MFRETLRGTVQMRTQAYIFDPKKSEADHFGFFNVEDWAQFICLMHVAGTLVEADAAFGEKGTDRVGTQHEIVHNGTDGADIIDTLRSAAGRSTVAGLRKCRFIVNVKPNRQTIYLMPRFDLYTVEQAFGGAVRSCEWVDISTALKVAQAIDTVIAAVMERGIENGPKGALVEARWEGWSVQGMVSPKIVAAALTLCRRRITRTYAWVPEPDYDPDAPPEAPPHEDKVGSWSVLASAMDWMLLVINCNKVRYCWGYDFSLKYGFMPSDDDMPPRENMNQYFLTWLRSTAENSESRAKGAMEDTFLHLCVEIGVANGRSMSTIHDPVPDYVSRLGPPASRTVIRQTSWTSCLTPRICTIQ